jgi:hypothetical protein
MGLGHRTLLRFGLIAVTCFATGAMLQRAAAVCPAPSPTVMAILHGVGASDANDWP